MDKYAYVVYKHVHDYETDEMTSDIMCGAVYTNKKILLDFININMKNMLNEYNDRIENDILVDSDDEYQYNPTTLSQIDEMKPSDVLTLLEFKYTESSILYEVECFNLIA